MHTTESRPRNPRDSPPPPCAAHVVLALASLVMHTLIDLQILTLQQAGLGVGPPRSPPCGLTRPFLPSLQSGAEACYIPEILIAPVRSWTWLMMRISRRAVPARRAPGGFQGSIIMLSWLAGLYPLAKTWRVEPCRIGRQRPACRVSIPAVPRAGLAPISSGRAGRRPALASSCSSSSPSLHVSVQGRAVVQCISHRTVAFCSRPPRMPALPHHPAGPRASPK